MSDTQTGSETRRFGVEIGRWLRSLLRLHKQPRPAWRAPEPTVNPSAGRHHRVPGGVWITRQTTDGRVLTHYDSRSEREATLTTMVRPVEAKDWPDGGLVTMGWPADRAI